MTQSFIYLYLFEKKVIALREELERFEKACRGDKERNEGKLYRENAYATASFVRRLESLQTQIESTLNEIHSV